MKKQEILALDIIIPVLSNTAMTYAERIHAKLVAAFNPIDLTVEDESARHAGHAGSRPGGETHFRVRVVADAFQGLSRVERQRRIYAVLADELGTQVHALALLALTPTEAQERR